jgi:hypothetical protein
MLTNNHMMAFNSGGNAPLLIKTIQKFNTTMWTHCNSVHHSKSIPLKDLNKSGVNSQICSFYKQKQDFAVLDQVILDTPPLEVMITRPLRSKKHSWECLARRYHPLTYDRKTGKQHLFKSFFPKLVSKHKTKKPTCNHTQKNHNTHDQRKNSHLLGHQTNKNSDNSSMWHRADHNLISSSLPTSLGPRMPC